MKNILALCTLILWFSTTRAQADTTIPLYIIYNLENGTSFVPLTDRYPFDYPYYNEDGEIDEADRLISPEYRSMVDSENDNYHVLSQRARKIFLDRLGVSESEYLFVYNLIDNELVTYTVEELKLCALLSPYSYGGDEFGDYDYFIGFEIAPSNRDDGKHFMTYVSIGEQNPFAHGNMKAIDWTEADLSDFPKEKLVNGQYHYNDTIAGIVHTYQTDGMTYFVKSNDGPHPRFHHVKIIDSSSKELLFDHYFFDGESAYMLPLNGSEHSDSYYQTPIQFTGKLLENYPPVIRGFQSHSFGCESIWIIGEDIRIPVLCDNRH